MPGLCPRPIGHGALSSAPGHFFLCTFHNLSSSADPKAQAMELARLHSYASPNDKYGFHVTTCCGSTKMPNNWESSWAQFFAKNRLLAILDDDRRNNGTDSEIDNLGRQCVEQVVPRLLGALETGGNSIKPVLVHGDLFVSWNIIVDLDGAEMRERIETRGNRLSMIPRHFTDTMNMR